MSNDKVEAFTTIRWRRCQASLAWRCGPTKLLLFWLSLILGRHGRDSREPLSADPGSRARHRAAGLRDRYRRQGQDLQPDVRLGIGLSLADRWLGIAISVAVALL
jgi:hypothetical protein